MDHFVVSVSHLFFALYKYIIRTVKPVRIGHCLKKNKKPATSLLHSLLYISPNCTVPAQIYLFRTATIVARECWPQTQDDHYSRPVSLYWCICAHMHPGLVYRSWLWRATSVSRSLRQWGSCLRLATWRRPLQLLSPGLVSSLLTLQTWGGTRKYMYIVTPLTLWGHILSICWSCKTEKDSQWRDKGYFTCILHVRTYIDVRTYIALERQKIMLNFTYMNIRTSINQVKIWLLYFTYVVHMYVHMILYVFQAMCCNF